MRMSIIETYWILYITATLYDEDK